MKAEPEIERDTIDWFRIGLVVAVSLAGLVLYFSGNRPAAYIVLGYALFGVVVMIASGSWRDSTEVARVRKSQWKRFVRNIPRNIFRGLLGGVAMAVVIAIGLVPSIFISNEFYSEHEKIMALYIWAMVGLSIAIYLWVTGLIPIIRQWISDLKDFREAADRAKERRSKEKEKP